MATSTVTASLVVQYGTAAGNAVLTAEFDEDKNAGKTQFGPGDTVWFRVYTTLSSYTVTTSSGTASKSGSGTSSEEDTLQFVNEKTATLSKPVKQGSVSVSWYGTGAGSLSLGSDKITVTCSALPASNVAVGKATYTAGYDSWSLSPPSFSGDEFVVVVFITG